MIIQQNSRMYMHAVNGNGIVPTIPSSADFTDGTWLATDLGFRELMINVDDDRAWFRTYNGIIELATSTSILFERINDDVRAIPNPSTSPMIPPSIITNSNNTNSGIANIIGGDANSCTGDYSILTGYSNIINAQYNIVGGGNNIANANANLIVGSTNDVSGEASVTFGTGNTNNYSGSIMGGNIAAGAFGIVAVGGQTTNATPKELFVSNSGTERIIIPVQSGYAVQITAIATDLANGDTKEFHGNGLIKNYSGTVALVGTITMSSSFGDSSLSSTSLAITADTINSSLKVTATGLSSTTINWLVSVTYEKIIMV